MRIIEKEKERQSQRQTDTGRSRGREVLRLDLRGPKACVSGVGGNLWWYQEAVGPLERKPKWREQALNRHPDLSPLFAGWFQLPSFLGHEFLPGLRL